MGSGADHHGGGAGRFDTTHWSIVLAAGRESPGAREAMALLCQTYWYPLYAYVRRCGHGAAEAEDLTQGFFADLLERDAVSAARRERGRFRWFLLASPKNFMANERERAGAEKRGGKVCVISFDARAADGRYLHEPFHELSPERLYERRWAMTLLEQVLDSLGGRYRAEGKGSLFEQLKPFIHSKGGDDAGGYAWAAEALGSTTGAVKVAVHRLRRRYAEALRAAIAQTVQAPEMVEEELRELFAAVKR